MIRLPFFQRSGNVHDISASQLFDEKTFYQKFLKDVARCQRELIIESPFMTTKRILHLMPLLQKLTRRGVQVVINTRHPDEHEGYLKNESEITIGLLQEAGALILFTGGHHRKLAIMDRSILWEGSLNILSQNESCEIMRRVNSSVAAQEMLNFLKIERHLNNRYL